MVRKKKGPSGGGAGLLPISSLSESRYSGLYRDTGLGGSAQGRSTTRVAGHDTATARPRYG